MYRRLSDSSYPRRVNYRSNGNMTFSCSDILKLIALIAVILACSLSAVQKFSGITFETGHSIQRIQPYTDICDKLKDCSTCSVSYESCIDYKNSVANYCMDKCSGYVSKYYSCQQQGERRCQIQGDNAQNCVDALLDSKMKAWDKYPQIPTA